MVTSTSLPSAMQALVLTGPGEFEIQTVPVPRPGPGEVLCRIRAITICGSDPGIIRGDDAGFWPPSYPFIPGHEWSGEVVALGPEVTGFRVGDRVAGEAHKGCGFCSRCLEGRYNLCRNYLKAETGHRHYGFTNQGAYAQYNAYSVKAINHLPDTIPFRVGALMDTVGIVAHAMELTGITVGGSVVVIGPGPIGLIAIRLARTLGAAQIIAVGRNPRLAVAGESADHLIDFETAEPVDAVRDLTGGLGVSEAFECSGAAGTFDQAVRMVQRGGRVGLLGVPPKDLTEALPFAYIVSNEIAIFGSKANPHVAERVISLCAGGRLPLEDLVTHSFPLEEFAAALDTFLSRRDGAMKVAVEPNGPES